MSFDMCLESSTVADTAGKTDDTQTTSGGVNAASQDKSDDDLFASPSDDLPIKSERVAPPLADFQGDDTISKTATKMEEVWQFTEVHKKTLAVTLGFVTVNLFKLKY